MPLVNTIYNIQPPDIDTLESKLFIILSLRGISYIVLNPANTFIALATYDFPVNTNGEEAANYINDLCQSEKILQQNFKRIYIIHAFAESILVPGEFMNIDARKDMLELVYGDNSKRIIRNDFMIKQYIYNVYGIPSGILSLLLEKFPAAIHSHQYSFLPDIIKGVDSSHLYCITENNYITVMLIKGSQLQVIQNFLFQTAIDAIYYLLNVCEQYEVDMKELTLYITGVLKNDTDLFNELNIHFSNIVLEHLPDNFSYDAEIAKLPSYYFSHLFSIASCVSSAG
jgi:uncharacterized protein DUF3822